MGLVGVLTHSGMLVPVPGKICLFQGGKIITQESDDGRQTTDHKICRLPSIVNGLSSLSHVITPCFELRHFSANGIMVNGLNGAGNGTCPSITDLAEVDLA